jgi:hypothetical protein
VSDAIRIATIGHRVRKPSAHTKLALRLPQQECELLAADSWQVKGKQRIVDHGGCGRELIREATRPNTDLLRESLTSRHSRRKNLISMHNPG